MEENWIRIFLVETIVNDINEEKLEKVKERCKNIFLDSGIEYKLELDSEVICKSYDVNTNYYVYICVKQQDEKMAKITIEQYLRDEKYYMTQFAKDNEFFNNEEN